MSGPETSAGTTAGGPPPWPRADEMPARPRTWGPARVAAGIAALLALIVVESVVFAVVSPPPEFQPVDVAAEKSGARTDQRLFALDAAGDTVWTLEPDGLGGLESAAEADVRPGSDYVAQGDLGGLGESSVALASGNSDVVSVHPERDGELGRARPLRVGETVRSLAAPAGARGEPTSLAVGTLGGEVRVFWPEGGRLRPVATIGVGALPESLATGDLDRDGRDDLVIGAADGRALVMLARGEGRFERVATIRLRALPRSLAAGNLDDDARAEIVQGAAGDQAWVLELSADGSVAARARAELDGSARGLAALDVIGDRGLELAAALDDDTVSVYRLGSDRALTLETDFRPPPPLAASLTLQAVLALSLVAVAFLIASPGGGLASPQALGLRRWGRSPWGIAVLGFLAYIGLSLALNQILDPEQEDIARELGFGQGQLANVAAGLLIVLAAPISEEIFFRGFLFGGLRTRLAFPIAAPLSAALWGVFHYGPGTIGVVIQLAIFGLVLAFLYERTGSLWPAIAVHAVNNALAFAVLVS